MVSRGLLPLRRSFYKLQPDSDINRLRGAQSVDWWSREPMGDIAYHADDRQSRKHRFPDRERFVLLVFSYRGRSVSSAIFSPGRRFRTGRNRPASAAALPSNMCHKLYRVRSAVPTPITFQYNITMYIRTNRCRTEIHVDKNCVTSKFSNVSKPT